MNSTLSSELQSGLAMDLPQLSDHVRTVLSTGQFSSETVETLRAACVEALRGSVALRKDEAHLAAACRIVECFLRAGVADRPVSAEFAAKLDVECGEGWGGLLAAMVQAPAWQLVAAPRLGDAPLPLWPVYTEWLFRLPVRAELPGQLDAMAGHYMQRLRELVAVAESNRGSAAVSAALDRYAQAESASLLVASGVSLRELVALRGKVLGLWHKVPKAEEVLLIPREGRRLRVGFVIESVGESAEVRFALPWFEWLDADRFEVVLFSSSSIPPEREVELSGRGWDLRTLSGGGEDDVLSMVNAALDIAVFFTKPLHRADLMTRLALHRVAPLQVCMNEEGLGAGLQNSDLLIVESSNGIPREKLAATEPIAVLPSAGVPFVRSHGRPASTCSWVRDDLGIPLDAVVFASVAPFRLITPELLRVWVGLLQQAPHARLLVYSYAPEDASNESLASLCVAVAAACADAGVDSTRFILSNEVFPSLAEVLELLRVADVYLDTFPASSSEGCRLALEAGLPVLCCRGAGERVHPLAESLIAMGLGSCVAADGNSLCALAVSLAQNAQERKGLLDSFKERLATPAHVWDPVAFGESIGALWELAFDRLASMGSTGFRKSRSPITVDSAEDLAALHEEAATMATIGVVPDLRNRTSKLLAASPSAHEVRLFYYQNLVQSGDSKRAAEGLLLLVERMPQRADIWFRLGQALIAAGSRTDGVNALETSLRIDPRNVDAWLALAGIALEADAASLRSEIREVLMGLAPEDPRVVDMAQRIDACGLSAGA